MKGAAWRGGVLAIATWIAAGTALGAGLEVTDNDRAWVNFTREAAVVGDNHFWLEMRGMVLMNDLSIKQPGQGADGAPTTFEGPTLGLNGYPINRPTCSVVASTTTQGCIEKIDGGRFDLVGAYGLGAYTELGFDFPFVMQQQVSLVDGGREEDAGVGDLVLYGKIKRQLADHWAGALGLELSIPSGSEQNKFGSGDFGTNPIISTRYESGRIAFGGHVGFLLNTGSQPDVFNWSVEALARGNAMFGLRCEVNGRLFRDFGSTFNDVSIWPGLDLNLTDNIIIRPQGLAHLSNNAVDWGLGLGLVFTM